MVCTETSAAGKWSRCHGPGAEVAARRRRGGRGTLGGKGRTERMRSGEALTTARTPQPEPREIVAYERVVRRRGLGAGVERVLREGECECECVGEEQPSSGRSRATLVGSGSSGGMETESPAESEQEWREVPRRGPA